MTVHYLKLHERYFDAVKYGFKKFEIRKNDRDFRVGDILMLKRFISDFESKQHDVNTIRTLEELRAKVTYLLTHDDFPDGIPEGYVVMTIEVF